MRVNQSMECDVRNYNHHQVDAADDDVVVAVIADADADVAADTNQNARLAY